MKKYVFTSILCAAVVAGCATQRASDTNNSQGANKDQQAAAQSAPTAPAAPQANEDQKHQDDMNSAGQKIGEKAREAEVRTRDDREKIKAGAADAAQKIKKGAKVAADDIKAAASGVKDGWNKGDQLDANTASEAQLTQAGLSKAEAQTVISHRPYRSKDDLKAVMTASSYEKIDGKVVVK
jgi:hypothetical protein